VVVLEAVLAQLLLDVDLGVCLAQEGELGAVEVALALAGDVARLLLEKVAQLDCLLLRLLVVLLQRTT
jgi:hypothetical protein